MASAGPRSPLVLVPVIVGTTWCRRHLDPCRMSWHRERPVNPYLAGQVMAQLWADRVGVVLPRTWRRLAPHIRRVGPLCCYVGEELAAVEARSVLPPMYRPLPAVLGHLLHLRGELDEADADPPRVTYPLPAPTKRVRRAG